MSKMPKMDCISRFISGVDCSNISTFAQAPLKGKSSYSPVVVKRVLSDHGSDESCKTGVMKHRWIFSVNAMTGQSPASGVRCLVGNLNMRVRVKLPQGITWERLAAMSPEEIHDKNLCCRFLPPASSQPPEGGMLFPKFHIEEPIKCRKS